MEDDADIGGADGNRLKQVAVLDATAANVAVSWVRIDFVASWPINASSAEMYWCQAPGSLSLVMTRRMARRARSSRL